MNVELFVSVLMAATAGFIVIAYESFASQMGLAVGTLFRNTTFQIVFGGLAVIGSVGFVLATISIPWGLLVLVLGFIGAFVLTIAFRSYVQWLVLLMLASSYAIQFLL